MVSLAASVALVIHAARVDKPSILWIAAVRTVERAVIYRQLLYAFILAAHAVTSLASISFPIVASCCSMYCR